MIKIPIGRYVPDDYTESLLLEVYRSGNLVQGPMVERFEKMCCEMSGAKYAAAVSNGTVAITLMLKQKLIPSTSHFVITNPLSFVATRNAIRHAGATPIFVDVDYETGFLNQEQVNKVCDFYKDQTVSIMVVDLHGIKDTVTSPSERVEIFRDASQSHRQHITPEDTAMSHSFHMSKNAVAGEGGVIVSDNEELINNIKLLRNHGMDDERNIIIEDAYNARMTDLQAAVGVGSLRNLENVYQKRLENSKFYDKKFKDIGGLRFYESESQIHHYVLRHKKSTEIIAALKHYGVDARKYYSELITYDGMISVFALTIAQQVCEDSFCIPVNEHLTDEDRLYVVEKVLEVVSSEDL